VLGLVGFGAIAQSVATRALAFGMQVIASDPFVTDLDAHSRGVELVEASEVFRRSDVVSLHLPLNDSTRNLVNREVLSSMKPSSILINTSRGGLIDPDALLEALDAGSLDRVGLDVTVVEPPTIDDRLRQHPRVLLTPHVGYWSDQSELALRVSVARIAVEELTRISAEGAEDESI
jgi:D-3-phosphoglycerate dehydrogenase